MFDIAMTVAACLQSGTRADVSWIIESEGLPLFDPSSAVVFTPGGGKIGTLGGGVLDGKLADLAGRASTGRLLNIEISDVDALIADLPSGGSARCFLVPAEIMPAETWDLALKRERFCVVVGLSEGDVYSIEVYSDQTIAQAEPEVQEIWERGGSMLEEHRAISTFTAVPRLVVVGGGPVAEALVRLAGYIGWDGRVASEASTASGLIAPLSAVDMVVIAAHDLELAGAGLQAGLDSSCGYLGSVGSRKMQSDRADWLAFRGVTDLDRVHGPAGLDIGADTPEEIAVAIVAEAIASRR